MSPIVSDPHNHVPEVSSEDLWGDAENLPRCPKHSSTVIPPRRPPPETNSQVAAQNPRAGLRIEPTPHRRQTDAPATPLEIQEIDGKVVRLDPELPPQPRIPRQAAAPQPIIRKNLGSAAREWGRAPKPSLRWTLAICLGISSLIIGGLILLPFINRPNATEAGRNVLTVEASEQITADELITALLDRRLEAEQLFVKFATTTVADDLSTIVRDPESVTPLIRASKRTMLISGNWQLPDNCQWNIHQNRSLSFAKLEGILPDFSSFSTYFLISEGQLLIDWKATTGYGTATFDDLANNQGNPAEIRGRIIPTDYYSPVFPESEFQSYQLIAPDNQSAIWCYARRNHVAQTKLSSLFHGGIILKPITTDIKVTLRLEHAPEKALPNQWMIGEMLHEEWITP